MARQPLPLAVVEKDVLSASASITRVQGKPVAVSWVSLQMPAAYSCSSTEGLPHHEERCMIVPCALPTISAVDNTCLLVMLYALYTPQQVWSFSGQMSLFLCQTDCVQEIFMICDDCHLDLTASLEDDRSVQCISFLLLLVFVLF